MMGSIVTDIRILYLKIIGMQCIEYTYLQNVETVFIGI